MTASTIADRIPMITPASSAHQKVSNARVSPNSPETHPASSSISVLMTSWNSPRVKHVIGIARNDRIGRMIALINERIRAITAMVSTWVSTGAASWPRCMPGRISAVSHRARPVTMRFPRILMGPVKHPGRVRRTAGVPHDRSHGRPAWQNPNMDDERGQALPGLSERWVPTADGRHLHVVVAGTGTDLVVLEAGLGAGALSWGPVLELLAPHCRVVAYDRAGYGRSDPDLRPRDLSRLADDLITVVGAVDHARLVLAGHSWGGPVVRLAAARLLAAEAAARPLAAEAAARPLTEEGALTDDA